MIIALSGLPGVGKDAIGKEVMHKLNDLRSHGNVDLNTTKGFSIKKFSTAVNSLYNQITGENYLKMLREEKELHRPKFVELAESMKEIFGQDVWAKRLMNMRYHKSNNWIITDLRFIEELKEITKFENDEDVFLFRIRRQCEECGLMEVHSVDCPNNNITSVETRLASYYGWNAIVNNNTTVEEAAEIIVTTIKYELSKTNN